MKVITLLQQPIEKITKKDCENIDLIGTKMNEIIERLNIISYLMTEIMKSN